MPFFHFSYSWVFGLGFLKERMGNCPYPVLLRNAYDILIVLNKIILHLVFNKLRYVALGFGRFVDSRVSGMYYIFPFELVKKVFLRFYSCER